MTTAPLAVGPELGLAGVATTVVALATIGLAALVSGPSGAAGAAIGAATVLVFFGFGAVTVSAVAALSPAAALPVALLTYVLQVVAVAMLFSVLRRSGVLGRDVEAGWVAAAIIVSTLVWLAAHLRAATRPRASAS
jgi:ATP synthase protein I